MARKSNELSETQLNPDKYAQFIADLKEFTIYELAIPGVVTRMTIRKYIRGNPVNPNKELAIAKALELAKQRRANRKAEVANEVTKAIFLQ